ncbi:MAG: T9SS type A sorting domain-containing protein, partial [Bacteroidota bacterium]
TNVAQNGPAIQFTMPGNFATGYVTVYANSNLCSPGISPPRTLTVSGKPATPATITPNPLTWCPLDPVNFSITAPSGPLPVFTWSATNGTINAGQSSTNVDIDWGTGSGFVRVIASNTCGSSGTKSQSFSSSVCREEAGKSSYDSQQFTVYPNPAHDKLTVSIDEKEQTQLNISLRDISGRIILSENHDVVAGSNVYELELKNMAKGVYMLEIQSPVESLKKKLVVE